MTTRLSLECINRYRKRRESEIIVQTEPGFDLLSREKPGSDNGNFAEQECNNAQYIHRILDMPDPSHAGPATLTARGTNLHDTVWDSVHDSPTQLQERCRNNPLGNLAASKRKQTPEERRYYQDDSSSDATRKWYLIT